MRMEQLEYLVDIAHTESLTATAQRLFTSQQVISKNIKHLEDELGTEILVRTNTGVYVTLAGQKVIEFAQDVLTRREKLLKDLQSVQLENEAIISYNIHSNSTIANYVIPKIITGLDKSPNKHKFKIFMENSMEEIVSKVQTGECDIGLITYNAEKLLRKAAAWEQELYVDILARDEVVALIHKRHIKNAEGVLSREEYLKRPKTIYNLHPEPDDTQHHTLDDCILISNDADFHRIMLEEHGAVVLMPGLAHQYFMKSKQFELIDLALERSLLHVAIYRRDADQRIQDLATMIRRKMEHR